MKIEEQTDVFYKDLEHELIGFILHDLGGYLNEDIEGYGELIRNIKIFVLKIKNSFDFPSEDE